MLEYKNIDQFNSSRLFRGVFSKLKKFGLPSAEAERRADLSGTPAPAVEEATELEVRLPAEPCVLREPEKDWSSMSSPPSSSESLSSKSCIAYSTYIMYVCMDESQNKNVILGEYVDISPAIRGRHRCFTVTTIMNVCSEPFNL